MAILPRYPGLDVSIRVEDQFAYEYKAPDDPQVDHHDRDIERYIECSPGARYGISICFDRDFSFHTYTPMAAHVYIDGALTNRRTFPRHRLDGHFVELIDAAEDFDSDGNQVRREFVFAEADIGKSFLLRRL
jgi:hypothetical protein